MTTSSTKNKFSETFTGKFLINTGVFLFWIIIWRIASAAVGKEILLPAPLAVVKRIFELSATTDFWASTLLSVLRIMLGFLIGMFGGVILGFLSFRFEIIKRLFSPLLTIIKATPVASFIILALIWLTAKKVPTFATFLIVLPIVCQNTLTALELTDKQLIEMETFFGFGPIKRIKTLYFHSFMPYFLSSAKMSLGLAWKAGIAAEVLCTPVYSIGTNLYESKIYLETTDVFAWTAVVILMSIVLEKMLSLIFEKLLKTKKPEVKGND